MFATESLQPIRCTARWQYFRLSSVLIMNLKCLKDYNFPRHLTDSVSGTSENTGKINITLCPCFYWALRKISREEGVWKWSKWEVGKSYVYFQLRFKLLIFSRIIEWRWKIFYTLGVQNIFVFNMLKVYQQSKSMWINIWESLINQDLEARFIVTVPLYTF